MHQLESMKEMLVGCVQGQMTHIDSVDTKELGEAIDMIKDLSEAIYYCTITEAMHSKENEGNVHSGHLSGYRDIDRDSGRMYYDGADTSYSMQMPMRRYEEKPLRMMRDNREGRSPMSRKSYMESKEMHHDKAVQMRELEKYMQELSQDVTEMIADATPEEKQILHQRLSALVTKLGNV